MSCGLMWFREDLRIRDNTALNAACHENSQVLGCYLIDKIMWKKHDAAACRVEFMLRNLAVLQTELAQKNIRLLIFELSDSKQTIPILDYLISEYKINTLYFNDQYELDEVTRDRSVIASLKISVVNFTDQVIFAPKELLTLSHTPYTIFTPYKNSFLKAIAQRGGITPLKTISACTSMLPALQLAGSWQAQGIIVHATAPNNLVGFNSNIPETYWPAGEVAAQQRLQQFIKTKISNYQLARDFPVQKGTSKLSAYLASGILSSRQCFAAAIKANNNKLQGGNPNLDCWISELIWREFYKQILGNFPRVSQHRAFKLETEKWPWRQDKNLFNAWQTAQTGYPLIDAAMRQLQHTGWMHNRLRMVVAMFFTKDCFLDWRWGEKFFMQQLVDGDLAANNGGWQWAASTGCDAAPYFRVFNPVRQSERFDPEGEFIKTYCPELKDVPLKQLHDPFKLPAGLNYPKPIVDYRNTRAFVIAAIKNIAK
jgi:deoxyribodipyrimidine photo-lyase